MKLNVSITGQMPAQWQEALSELRGDLGFERYYRTADLGTVHLSVAGKTRSGSGCRRCVVEHLQTAASVDRMEDECPALSDQWI